MQHFPLQEALQGFAIVLYAVAHFCESAALSGCVFVCVLSSANPFFMGFSVGWVTHFVTRSQADLALKLVGALCEPSELHSD